MNINLNDPMMALIAAEFLQATPTAVIAPATVMEDGSVQVQIPLPQMFQQYVQRRLELAAQGIGSMAGQTIETQVPADPALQEDTIKRVGPIKREEAIKRDFVEAMEEFGTSPGDDLP